MRRAERLRQSQQMYEQALHEKQLVEESARLERLVRLIKPSDTSAPRHHRVTITSSARRRRGSGGRMSGSGSLTPPAAETAPQELHDERRRLEERVHEEAKRAERAHELAERLRIEHNGAADGVLGRVFSPAPPAIQFSSVLTKTGGD